MDYQIIQKLNDLVDVNVSRETTVFSQRNYIENAEDSLFLLDHVRSGDLKIACGSKGYRIFLRWTEDNRHKFVTLWGGKLRGAVHPDFKIALVLAALCAAGFTREELSEIVKEKLIL